jgi:hypothetical protein
MTTTLVSDKRKCIVMYIAISVSPLAPRANERPWMSSEHWHVMVEIEIGFFTKGESRE